MKTLFGIIVLLSVASPSSAGVLYHFYGYGDCRPTACVPVATGKLWLNDDLSFNDWSFSNLLTGVDYTLSDPRIDAFNGLFGLPPANAGTADIRLDFAGEGTYFATGITVETGGISGSATGWEHAGIEALQPTDAEGNLTPLQQSLNMVSISGLHHLWVREAAVPEPGMLVLLGLGLAGVLLRRRH